MVGGIYLGVLVLWCLLCHEQLHDGIKNTTLPPVKI